MASHNFTTGPKLTPMQMRLQQRREEEREKHRLEVMQRRKNSASQEVNPPRPANVCRVSQMADERARGSSMDRSRATRPSPPKPRPQSVMRASGGGVASISSSGSSSKMGTSFSYDRPSPSATTQKRSTGKQRANINENSIAQDMASMNLGGNGLRNDRDSRAQRSTDSWSASGHSSTTSTSKLKAPMPTRTLSPTPATRTRQTPSTSTPTRSTPSRSPQRAIPTKAGPPRKPTGGSKSLSNMGIRHQSFPETPEQEEVGTCRFCNRHFILERLPKHEAICEKMVHTKRKIFDAAFHRLRGTGAEKYLKKQSQSQCSQHTVKQSYSSAAAAIGMTAPLKKNNWRKKHEEFVQAIRAAKKLQEHLARGGKVSDLPPPPPSENPDYIQCPHCLRRFNEPAAERHIPRCANMKHNKPKPKAAQASRTR